eukprot:gene20704-7634_t
MSIRNRMKNSFLLLNQDIDDETDQDCEKLTDLGDIVEDHVPQEAQPTEDHEDSEDSEAEEEDVKTQTQGEKGDTANDENMED